MNHAPTARADRLYLGGFVFANLLLKLALVPLNGGEYTDGILQLTVFQHNSGLYPPLYGALSSAVATLGLPLEMAGRVVSAIASSLTLIPVFLLTRLLFGSEAARLAAVLFTCSPLVLRWSIRAMTDSLFLVLFTTSLYLSVKAWTLLRDPEATECPDCRIAISSVVAALAAFTRYQGVLLVPLLIIVVVVAWRHGRVPLRALVGVVPWLGVGWWLWQNSGVHQGQFAGRTAATGIATVGAYWNTAESFVLISPYYFGYPVIALAIVGVLRGRWRRFTPMPFATAGVLVAGGLLGLQAMFGSFQYRYMMPALPLVIAVAGGGGEALYRLSQRRKLAWVYRVGMGAAVVYLAIFACAVLVLQRQAFADQKAAAHYVREVAKPTDPIFANEQYGTFYELGCVKLSFWTGRKVQPLLDPKNGTLVNPPAGAWVLVGSHYGGADVQEQMIARLRKQVPLQEVTGGAFRSEILPLMDDIMAQPMLNQNPLGWVVRYVPQRFSTRVFRVAPIL